MDAASANRMVSNRGDIAEDDGRQLKLPALTLSELTRQIIASVGNATSQWNIAEALVTHDATATLHFPMDSGWSTRWPETLNGNDASKDGSGAV